MGGLRAVKTAVSSEPLVVRLRPNLYYLAFLLVAATVLGYGITLAGALGAVIAVCAGIVLVLWGYPVVLSAVCRMPVIVADDDELRFPLMGPRLAWADVASVRRSVGGRLREGSPPVLLVYPADPEAAVRKVRPWLRREARGNLATYGTPIVVPGASLDQSLDDIDADICGRLARKGLPERPGRASSETERLEYHQRYGCHNRDN